LVAYQHNQHHGVFENLDLSLDPSVVRQLSGNEDPQWYGQMSAAAQLPSRKSLREMSPRATGLDLEAERLRLEWAIRWHSVPRVLDRGANDEVQWMVTAALPGESGVTEAWLAWPLEAAFAIGRGLRMLHDTLPVADCPLTGCLISSSSGRPKGRRSCQTFGQGA
jgi:kanamycin kinase